VEDIIIISGFIPKFPSSKAEFYDMFKSQEEREAFKNRPEVLQAREHLKTSMNTKSRAYLFMDWKIQYAACQFYYLENWPNAEGGLGLFNGEMNELIGPESNIGWMYFYYFWKYQRQFNNGELDAQDTKEFTESSINYLPEIKNHSKKITFLLGRYEVGDWNLRMYERTLGLMENADMHIFEKSGHVIWMDEPEAFHQVLGASLAKINPSNHLVLNQ
jgi:pimeloyl-ACP methyl ester carboxylesterase